MRGYSGNLNSVDSWNGVPLRRGKAIARGVRLVARPVIALILLLVSAMYLIGVLSLALNFKVVVVSSGSMEPSIGTWDAAILIPVAPESVQTGDVIGFRSAARQSVIIHRVVSVQDSQGHTYFETRGDANPVSDPDPAPAEALRGKIVLTFPEVGRLLLPATALWGKVALVAGPWLILLLSEIWNAVKARKTLPEALARQRTRQVNGPTANR